MITKIQTKKGKLNFVTSQYECGTYIAIYDSKNGIPSQSATQLKEADYHKKIRKICVKTEGHKFIKNGSTVL